MHIDQHLHELELELLQPRVRRSPELLSFLLAADFREFGGSGRVYTRDEIIEALQTEVPAQILISEFRVQSVGADAALVTYRATRNTPDGPPAISMRSSLWVVRDGHWQMLFHQGTRVL